MGQTTSSSCVSSSPALSSSSSLSGLSASSLSSTPSDYGYNNHPQPIAYSSQQPEAPDSPTPPPSDGYRWRKYGQKSVKGSAYARNYYKCTYPGCTVKKQVDKINNNGKIVDQVLCKGEHCHGPPQITRINAHDQQTFRNSVMTESLAHTEIMVKQEDSPSRGSFGTPLANSGGLRGNSAVGAPINGSSVILRRPNVDTAPMMYPMQSPYGDVQHPNGLSLVPVYNPEGPETLLNELTTPITNKSNDDNNNNLTHSNGAHIKSNGNLNSLIDPNLSEHNNNNNNKNETKVVVPTTPTSHLSTAPVTTISSPRLVIETNTNVDCLDDGYHWRKYGQKTVKGSPFPRSYYKCTEKGCSVKKQVEQNGTSIVNTYEGTHTHLAPAMDDNMDMIKKRRNRRSEGQEFTPFKRLHTSSDDSPSNNKSAIPSPLNDTLQPAPSSNHCPMPIGSMGSILHHTSHLHSSISYLGSPPLTNLYSSPADPHSYSTLPKVRPDTSAPILAPLHSFSHSDHPPSG